MSWHKLLRTNPHDTAALLLRLALGIVMLPHGLQKLLGWFGGPGFEGSMGFLTGMVGVPTVIAILVILGESVGAIALLFGLFTRVCSAGIAVILGYAALTVHASNGFFMNWSGAQTGEGFEFHILAVGIALALVITGGGMWSADGWIERKK